jgi:F-type H+-transporting ATPase subunit b
MALDNTFWAFIALILFLVLITYFKVPGMITKALDARAARIRSDLEEARSLKDEAKAQLAEYQRRRQEAETEAREIVEGARREASGILQEAKTKSEDYVTRRAAMAELKINQAEADAIAEVRSSAVDIAVAAATKIISDRNASGRSGSFIDQSIQDVRKQLN